MVALNSAPSSAPCSTPYPVHLWPDDFSGAVPALDGGLLLIAVQTEGGTQRDGARRQIRHALQEVLGALFQLPPAGVEIVSAPGRPPHILLHLLHLLQADDGPRRIHCSIAHEAGLAMAAVSTTGPVGVDLMQVQDVPDWQSVARDYLGPEVAAALAACSDGQRPRAFAQAWTSHEAGLKCRGRQLSEWTAHDHDGVHIAQLAIPSGSQGKLAAALAQFQIFIPL